MRRRAVAAAGVLLGVVVLVGPVPGGAASAHAGAASTRGGGRGDWTAQVTYPAPIGGLATIVCTQPLTCVALGSSGGVTAADPLAIVATTADGGQHWASRPLPFAVGLGGLACPSTSMCVAVGGTVGRGPATSPLSEGAVLVSQNSGRTWSSRALPTMVGTLSSVSCPSTTFCLAVGATPDGTDGVALESTDGGASWTRVTLPAGQAGLRVVDCAGPGACVVVGSRYLRTVDGGKTWTLSNQTPGLSAGVACPSLSSCVVVGGTVAGDANPESAIGVTRDGGTVWSEAPLPTYAPDLNSSGFLSAISCGSSEICLAVGGGIGPRGGPGVGVVFTTTDGGATWADHPGPTGMGGLSGVSCSGPTVCVVDGTDPSAEVALSAVTTDGGAIWSVHDVAFGVGVLDGLSCPSRRQCAAVGAGAGAGAAGTVVVRTGDAGTSWSRPSVPGGPAPMTAVACSSVARCVAVGGYAVDPADPDGLEGRGAIVATSDGGVRWRSETVPSGVGLLTSVACAAATSCVAVGTTSDAAQDMGQGSVVTSVSSSDGGARWTAPVKVPITEWVSGVSCPTATVCLAVGEDQDESPPAQVSVVAVTRNGGRSWVAYRLPGRGEVPSAISCVSTVRCVAVGAVTFDESTPGASGPATVAPGEVMTTVDGGRKWRGARVGSGNLTAVDCRAPLACVAVGRRASGVGQVALWDRDGGGAGGGNGAWTVVALPGSVGAVDAVSCPVPSRCVVAGATDVGGGLVGSVTLRSDPG